MHICVPMGVYRYVCVQRPEINIFSPLIAFHLSF